MKNSLRLWDVLVGGRRSRVLDVHPVPDQHQHHRPRRVLLRQLRLRRRVHRIGRHRLPAYVGQRHANGGARGES